MYAACGHLWPGTVRPGMSFWLLSLPFRPLLYLLRFDIVQSMMADSRYEIEIGPGIVDRWLD